MDFKTQEKIVILRHRQGWTQDGLAKKAYMSASTIARIESGNRPVTEPEMHTFAKLFGVEATDLMDETKKDKTPKKF